MVAHESKRAMHFLRMYGFGFSSKTVACSEDVSWFVKKLVLSRLLRRWSDDIEHCTCGGISDQCISLASLAGY